MGRFYDWEHLPIPQTLAAVGRKWETKRGPRLRSLGIPGPSAPPGSWLRPRPRPRTNSRSEPRPRPRSSPGLGPGPGFPGPALVPGAWRPAPGAWVPRPRRGAPRPWPRVPGSPVLVQARVTRCSARFRGSRAEVPGSGFPGVPPAGVFPDPSPRARLGPGCPRLPGTWSPEPRGSFRRKGGRDEA